MSDARRPRAPNPEAMDRELEGLRSEVAKLRDELDERNAKVATLENDLAAAELRVEELADDVCDLEARKTIDEARNAAADLENHLQTCLYCEARVRYEVGGYRCVTAYQLEENLHDELRTDR